MQFNNVYENKSVFITGHTGFKGSWLAEWLLKLKAKVTGFSLDPPTEPSHFALTGLSERIANDIRGDIRNYDSVRRAIFDCKPDFIFHLAAQPIVRKAFNEPLFHFAFKMRLIMVHLCHGQTTTNRRRIGEESNGRRQ